MEKIQVIKYKCCGKIYAACCEPECYTDKDWLKNLKRYVNRGDTVEMLEAVNPFSFGKCECVKASANKQPELYSNPNHRPQPNTLTVKLKSMAYKTCPDCGTKLGSFGCPNCNEHDYISMQEDYVPSTMHQSNHTPEQRGKLVYFIEDRRNGKWLKFPQSFDDMMIDTRRSSADEESRKWTNDPLQAMQFETFNEADAHKKKYWNMADIEVTEHLFVSSPTSIEQQGVNVYYKERVYQDVPNHFHFDVNHLAERLTSYPLIGPHSFKDGEDVTGRYELGYQIFHRYNDGMGKWDDSTLQEYTYCSLPKRIVAIPVPLPEMNEPLTTQQFKEIVDEAARTKSTHVYHVSDALPSKGQEGEAERKATIDQREKDIQELCKGVLEMSPSRYYNPNGADESSCPLCNAIDYGLDHDLKDLPHKLDCPYLIAKDLSTNTPKP